MRHSAVKGYTVKLNGVWCDYHFISYVQRCVIICRGDGDQQHQTRVSSARNQRAADAAVRPRYLVVTTDPSARWVLPSLLVLVFFISPIVLVPRGASKLDQGKQS